MLCKEETSFPSNRSSDDDNPYYCDWLKLSESQLDRENQILDADLRKDHTRVAEILSIRKALVVKYAHAIPTTSALEAIAFYSPVIEIGAGTGYWAYMLRRQGTDVICYDRYPPGNGDSVNRYHEGAVCWTEVLCGDETKIETHSAHTLLLCWPPQSSDMPINALSLYRGEFFLYVGELPDEEGHMYLDRTDRMVRKGVTIKKNFFHDLRNNWNLIQTVVLPHWEICADNLYVFRRRTSLRALSEENNVQDAKIR